VAGRADDLIQISQHETATVVIDIAHIVPGATSSELADAIDATDRSVVLIFWESTEVAHNAAMLGPWMDQVEAYMVNNTVRGVILVGLQNEGHHMFDAIDVLETPCVYCSMAAGVELLERGATIDSILPTTLGFLRIHEEQLGNALENGLKSVGDAMRMAQVGTLDLQWNGITPRSLSGFAAAASPSHVFKHLSAMTGL
jgi:hypothetical protein